MAALLTGIGALAGVDPLVCPPGVVVGEGLFTEGALVELLLGVTPLVYPQVVRHSETFPTVITSERLLTHMVQPDVGIKVGGLGETLATGSAEEGALTSMGDHVGLEVWCLGEPLATLGALEWLHTSVCAVMQLQTLQAGETLSTFSALVVLLVLVSFLVGAEADKKLEAFAARQALVWHLVRMCDLVNFKALCSAEGLAAGKARNMLLYVV